LNTMGLSSMQIVEIRSLFTALILFSLLAVFSPKLLKIKIKDLWCFFGGGIGSIILFNFCYFQTISHSSLSFAALLLYTSPVFVTVLSVFLFKEKLTIKKVFCLITTFIGCAFASGVAGGMNFNLEILLLGLGSGFGYALYSIFSRFALIKEYHPVTITAYVFLFAAIGGIPITDFSEFSKGFSDTSSVLFLILFTVVTTIFPYIIYTIGLKHLENGIASVLACVEPVMATLFGLLFFSEFPNLWGWLGIIIVVISLIILNFSVNEQK